VRRERSGEDRRLVHAWITADGLSLLGELDAPVAAADRTVIAGLTTEETDRLVAALERVRGNVT
jgi:DNA-binding MarR family transcriptional regulator